MSHHFEATLGIRSMGEAVDKRVGGGGLLCYKVMLYVHVGVKRFGSDACLGSLRDTGKEFSLKPFYSYQTLSHVLKLRS
jgi:hypothetical protein